MRIFIDDKIRNEPGSIRRYYACIEAEELNDVVLVVGVLINETNLYFLYVHKRLLID